jgi:hypothetical protein
VWHTITEIKEGFMATTRLRDRIFAGLGAAVFLVTASALTIGVIVDMVKQSNKPKPVVCAAKDTEETLTSPEVFKPEAAAPKSKRRILSLEMAQQPRWAIVSS